MILPDVKVLIYALRPDLPQHPVCHRRLTRVVTGEAAFAVSRQVSSSVVRISTAPRALRMPCTLEEAFGFCVSLLDQPHGRIVEPGEDHWGLFVRRCREADTRGARVTDAWLAALAIEHGCEWKTLHRDFARFPGLRWRAPSESGQCRGVTSLADTQAAHQRQTAKWGLSRGSDPAQAPLKPAPPPTLAPHLRHSG